MSPMRLTLSLIALLLMTAHSIAAGEMPVGSFQIINSAGFTEFEGKRPPLDTDIQVKGVDLQTSDSGSLILTINGTEIVLFEIKGGLASLSWDAGSSSLLHYHDILELSGHETAKDVPAWGANIDWPDLGQVQLVLLPLRQNAYTGFLVSHPGSRTVVRQMELRKAGGPPNRPSAKALPPAPAIN